MKYWLIFMLFTNKGEYIDKIEAEYQSFGSCVVAAGSLTTEFINSSTKIQAYCVTNDHYMGRKQDEGVDYD